MQNAKPWKILFWLTSLQNAFWFGGKFITFYETFYLIEGPVKYNLLKINRVPAPFKKVASVVPGQAGFSISGDAGNCWLSATCQNKKYQLVSCYSHESKSYYNLRMRSKWNTVLPPMCNRATVSFIRISWIGTFNYGWTQVATVNTSTTAQATKCPLGEKAFRSLDPEGNWRVTIHFHMGGFRLPPN